MAKPPLKIPKLKLESSTPPVTALAFFSPTSDPASSSPPPLFLLAGEDNHLAIYHISSSQLASSPILRLKIFSAQPIHGIHVGTDPSSFILLWGGRSITAIARSDLEKALQDGTQIASATLSAPLEILAPDWIYDAVLLPDGTGEGALVTGHNEVVPLHIGSDGNGPASVELGLGGTLSPSRSVLYSASVSWAGDGRVLVVAGTVFGEVVVWACDSRFPHDNLTVGNGDTRRCQILHVLEGHEGSIFGVSILPDVPLGGGHTATLLASCSDDRTVRIWDITDRLGVSGHIEAQRDMAEISSTEVAPSKEPLAVAMGHLSRIWKVRMCILPHRRGSEDGGEIVAYSFGEDATVIEWALELDLPRWRGRLDNTAVSHDDATRPFGRLVQRRTFAHHSGKHIWSTALKERPGKSPLLATGGADGKIVVLGDLSEKSSAPSNDTSIQEPEAETSEEVTSLTLEEVMASASQDTQVQMNGNMGYNGSVATSSHQPGGEEKKKPLMYNYAFITPKALLAVASTGELFIGDLRRTQPSWSRVSISDTIRHDLKKYPVLRSADNGLVFLGTATGGLHVYSEFAGQVTSLGLLPQKVQAIFVLPDASSQQRQTYKGTRIVVTMMGRDEVTIADIDSTGSLRPSGLTQLRVEKGSNISSASICGDYLVLGTRKGLIHLFRTQNDGSYLSPGYQYRTQSRDSVLSITPLPGQTSRQAFLATFRDGKYRIYDILGPTTTLPGPRLHLVHESTTPFSSVVHSAWFQPRSNASLADSNSLELILAGFRGPSFSIWNETQQREVASHDCGGANRSYTYVTDPRDSEGLSFVYTRASAVHVYRKTSSASRGARGRSLQQLTVKTGAHGREIRAASRSEAGLIATGAEDTVIRLWRHDNPDSNPRCVAVLKQHDTGIQCLRWLGSSYLLSSGGAEELYIWRVSALDSAYKGLAVVREAALPARSKTKDLRVMSFDVEACGGDEKGMFITLALSDSTVEMWRYCPSAASVEGAMPVTGDEWVNQGDDDSWTLLAKGRYTGACPTQLKHLQLCRVVGGGLVIDILVGFTDGTVSIWRAKTPADTSWDAVDFTMMQAVRAHQNAVKSLDLKDISQSKTGKQWLIITGGDDNALAFTTLRLEYIPPSSISKGGLMTSFETRSRISSAHAAAITGIRIMDVEEASPDTVVAVTCSNDQRVKVWRISTRAPMRVQLLANEYSSVADPGDIEAVGPDGRFMVVGVGVETWRLT